MAEINQFAKKWIESIKGENFGGGKDVIGGLWINFQVRGDVITAVTDGNSWAEGLTCWT